MRKRKNITWFSPIFSFLLMLAPFIATNQASMILWGEVDIPDSLKRKN